MGTFVLHSVPSQLLLRNLSPTHTQPFYDTRVAPGLESWPQEALLLGAYKLTPMGLGFLGGSLEPNALWEN